MERGFNCGPVTGQIVDLRGGGVCRGDAQRYGLPECRAQVALMGRGGFVRFELGRTGWCVAVTLCVSPRGRGSALKDRSGTSWPVHDEQRWRCVSR